MFKNTYDKAGNLTREIEPDGTTNYTYSAQNKLLKGEKTNGESSEYVYNALGVRIENVQIRTNKNAGNQNADLKDGSHGTDYMRFLKDGRATWQRVWESEIGTTVQNDKETVTRHYVVDYLSIANRDIFVTEDGSYTTRYVYDAGGRRLSAEFDYAPGTKRGEAGENLQSDIAVEIGKVFYRTSILGSTLFAVDKNGDVIAHAIYDPWGKPLTETYTDSNYSGLENLNNYTGYTWDITLKLYFAQNRFYDADTHRFTQEDTAKDGANWYVYCGNGPVLRVDCLGGESYSIYRNGSVTGQITDFTYSDENCFWVREVIPALKNGSVYYNSNDKTVTLYFNGYTASINLKTIDKAPNRTMSVAVYEDSTGLIEGNITLKYYNGLLKDRLYVNIIDINKFLKPDEKIHIMLPTSGAELKYEPSKWNQDGVQERTNCYAYAVNMTKYDDGKAFLSHFDVLQILYGLQLGDNSLYQQKLKCGYSEIQMTFALQPGVYLGKTKSLEAISIEELYNYVYEDLMANPTVSVKKISQYDRLPT